MNRRDFIKFISLTGLGCAFPSGLSYALAASRRALPVPGLLKVDATGRMALTVGRGQTSWKQTPTSTWGYNGPLLGPALSLRRGQKVSMEVRNYLTETTTVHWHGLEIPGTSDGGPQAMIEAGAVWKATLPIEQKAATCWYHPHMHGKTGKQVAMGLGGLLLIEDEESDKLPLSKKWGEDDVPLLLQDKRLNASAQIDYALDIVSASVGWFGDFLLANGSLYPEHSPPRGWLRLRLLNGCNARSLSLACSDKRPLYVIAGDGGFLPEPVKLQELTVYPAERFELMIDCDDGNPFDLISLPTRQMGMRLPPFDKPLPVLRITPSLRNGHKILPDRLVTLPALPSLEGLPVRTLHLAMDPRLDMQGMMELMKRYGKEAMSGTDMNMDMKGQMGSDGMMHDGTGAHGGMHGTMNGMSKEPFDLFRANSINGRPFTMNTAAFNVKQGQYERWIISGKGDMMLHPFHIHGGQFRILRENGAEPQEHRRGLKDVVSVHGKESEVLVRFMHPAPPERMYMAHCHLLEHEDTGMMLAFTVSA